MPNGFTNPEELHTTGDLLLDSLIVNTSSGAQFDLLPFVENIDIFEDLYANAISGAITLVESANLIQNIPLLGQETVDISFKTAGSLTKLQYRVSVYKISERIQTTDRGLLYKLHFTSVEFLRNFTNKFSKAMTGTPSELVDKIFRLYLKTPGGQNLNKIEASSPSMKMVVPFWEPLKTINWLGDRTQSAVNANQAGFLFFQTIRNGYYFVSLAGLLSSAPVIGYTAYPKGFRPPTDIVGNRDVVKEFTNAYSYKIDSSCDRLAQITTGTFGSTTVAYDPVFRAFSSKVYSYKNSFQSAPHLNQNPILPAIETLSNGALSTLHRRTRHSFAFDGILDNTRSPDYTSARNSIIKQLQDTIIRVSLPGDSRRQAGDVVYLEVPSNQAIAPDDDWIDRRLTGNYLITAIHHNITKINYSMDLEVAKDSFVRPYPTIKTIG